MLFKLDRYNKKLISLSGFSILVVLGLIFRISLGSSPKRDLSNFTTFAIKGSLPGLINSSGELQSVQRVIISPKKQGIVEYIYVEEGDLIEKGQLLAKMDSGDLIYRIRELKSDFEKEKAIYERRKFLFSEGAISKENHEEYKNLFLKSEARLKQIEVEKSDTEIRAPFKGTITSRDVDPGAFVIPAKSSASSPSGDSKNTAIFELSQGLKVMAKVPESDIGRIQIGQEASIRVDSFPEKRFKATVKKISPRAVKSNNVTSFEVTLLLLDSPNQLRIGMTADIEFQTGATAINTLIPTVAIVTRNGIPGVLLVGSNNEPDFKKIELGISSGDKTAIINGVKPGDQIFIDLPPWAKEKRSKN